MANFTKSDLIERVSELDDIQSKAAATRTVSMVFNTIMEQVSEGTNVQLAGFINLKKAVKPARSARMGRNPSTGTPLQIAAQPAKNVVRIKPAAAFKDRVS